MQSVKSVFSIKDLENLSGIKAHTIRIWEKRYNILEPMRTETNIRFYDIYNLQKLLNITLLHNYGYKISTISKYPAEKIPVLVREIISEKSVKNHAINAFKMAMINFDQSLFITTYNNLLSEKSFREIFNEIFIPLLNEIGLLWQTDTIKPAHEHFISNLILQKLIINTEKVQILEPEKKEKVFVLFLPINEVHELGLMYLNYEISLNGYRSIYLGANIPFEDLKDIAQIFNDIVFVSYMTVSPEKEAVEDYILRIKNEIIKETSSELWLLGKNTEHIYQKINLPGINMFRSLNELITRL
ncbi:MerR family transcriptional regulator [Flavobacterium sp. PLA-1-15]|uniref:MerR family transcriptional regulator n=1 Tax=Flavobacterium sp. PLA-1-15 TaxID=3380533 RepID=UPI003B7F4F64